MGKVLNWVSLIFMHASDATYDLARGHSILDDPIAMHPVDLHGPLLQLH
jgi:hypothetical protein